VNRLVLASIVSATALLAQSKRPGLDVDLASFDQVWTTVRDTHWQKPPAGLDWDAIRAKYRPRVEASTNTDQARTAMQEMLGELHQTHFGIIPGVVFGSIEDSEDTPGAGTTGIDLRVLDGEAVVTALDPGSSAERSGVGLGWIIRSVNGRPLRPVIDRASQDAEIHELQLTRSLLARLSGTVSESIDVTFLGAGNREVTLPLKLGSARGPLVEFGNLPPSHVWYEDKHIGSTVYARFNLFLDIPRLMPAFEATVKGCKPCDGLIIDLRGNPGGIGGMAMGMAGFLLNTQGQRLGTMYARDTTLNFVVNPRADVFGGPVAVLIDANSASTAEIFAGGLQDLKRARIFGTRSAGAALPSVFTRLPNGDGFQYAIANYVSRNGQTLEGAGVQPDREVKLTRAGLLASHDAVLDAALEWIRSQGGGQ
jgi:carboxyl-terminal processing protease